MRRLAHLLLTLCLLVSTGAGAYNLFKIATNPAVGMLVERTGENLAVALSRTIQKDARQPEIEAHLSRLLAEDPRNWLVITSVQEIASDQRITLNPALISRIEQMYAEDHSMLKTTGKCLACGWDPAACELSAILLCRAPVDLTPVGDVGGILRESANYATGREVDKIDLTLSAVGLGATALAPMTGGSSLSLKLGASALKTTKKLGNLSPGLARTFTRTADEAIDWDMLSKTRAVDLPSRMDDLVNADALRPVLATMEAAGDIRSTQGIPTTLHLMKFVDSTQDAKATARLSTALGPRTAGAFEVIGKSRLIRATLRYSDEALAAIIAIASALISLGLLIGSLTATRTLKLLKRHMS